MRKRRHERGLLTIGEIAGELGVLSSQVRYYTQLGLLEEDSRTQGRYRLYRKEGTLKRLKEILQLKKEGLSLAQIRKRIGSKHKFDNPHLTEAFKKYPVKFAYLFGSHAKGRATNLSDIDIAVYLDEDLSGDERFKLQLKLIGDITTAFRTDKIDLIILNDSPLLLSFNAISDSGIIYSIDEHKRVEFETRIMSLYFDQQYYYRRHAEATIDRIARKGIL